MAIKKLTPSERDPSRLIIAFNQLADAAQGLVADLETLRTEFDAQADLNLSGNGTPEGNVVAVVGARYARRDGGAATSFYVKESGTGNTGWVAK